MSGGPPKKKDRPATRCPKCQKIHPWPKGMKLKLCATCEDREIQRGYNEAMRYTRKEGDR